VAAGYGNETVTTTSGPWTPLPARGTASVSTSIRAADCYIGTPHVPFATNPEGVLGGDIALPVYLSDTKTANHSKVVGAWARLDPAFTARVNRQLAALCP
jgi:hypothetical protein